jgi:hypothetical protein
MQTKLSLMSLFATAAFGYQFNLPGVSKPLGFFDPLQFSKNLEPIEFKKIQEAELKHSRVAMLASLGLLVQDYFHPLFGLKDKVIGEPIYHFQIIADQYPYFIPLVISSIGLIEFFNIYRGWELTPIDKIANLKDDYVVGDLGLNPFQFSEEEFHEMRTKELNNGRLAMIATLLLVLQQLS